MRFAFGSALLALILAVVIPCGAALAHEGHDHGDQPTTSAPIAPRASSVSDKLELVAVARGSVVTIHVDSFETNEPVSGAAIEVETPEGMVKAEPTEPGSYRIAAPWSSKTGEYEITVTVTSGTDSEVFPLSLDVHGAEPATAPPAKTSWLTTPAFAAGLRNSMTLDAGAIALGSFLAGAIVVSLVRRRRTKTAALVALLFFAVPIMEARADGNHADSGPAAPALGLRDQAQRMSDGTLFVPKPTQRILEVRTILSENKPYKTAFELPGRVIADPNGSGMVQSAQGGRLSAPPKGFPRIGARVKKGDVLAYAAPPVQLVDSSDMLQRQGELDQQIMIVEKRVNRFDTLARSGIVSQVQADEARAELRGLRERRAGLDKVRAAPEALIAPIDGVVAEASAVAGQIAQPSAIVFQIVDPQRLLIEAQSFQTLKVADGASARTVAGENVKLRFLGAGLTDRNQAVAVHFAIDGDASALRVGQFVTVMAARDEGLRGIAVPRESVVRGSNGQNLVFEKTGAEKFEPREVRVQPLDGERVIVAAGIEPGKRMVTGGAELLNQIR